MPRGASDASAIAGAIDAVAPLDTGAMAAARERQARLTKPAGSLGRLEELGIALAGMTGQPRPRIARRVVIVCAADHGVAARGVSAYPRAVTAQMVYNFVRGGAAINALARRAGARVLVADVGVDHDFPPDLPIVHAKVGYGTADISVGPAMSRAGAERAVATGIDLARRAAPARATGVTVVVTGDMGIGNTTSSSAIVAALTGAPAAEVTGRGTGIDDQAWGQKVAVIRRALETNRAALDEPMGVLAALGGYEIAALVGVILGAGVRRCPVVIDGFISGAAALVAVALCPAVRDFLVAGHLSVEIGHRLALERLALAPLLRLDLRLGEGTGAVLALGLLDGAVAVLRDMATFDEAGVAERSAPA